jgi:hypothetical protein
LDEKKTAIVEIIQECLTKLEQEFHIISPANSKGFGFGESLFYCLIIAQNHILYAVKEFYHLQLHPWRASKFYREHDVDSQQTVEVVNLMT